MTVMKVVVESRRMKRPKIFSGIHLDFTSHRVFSINDYTRDVHRS